MTTQTTNPTAHEIISELWEYFRHNNQPTPSSPFDETRTWKEIVEAYVTAPAPEFIVKELTGDRDVYLLAPAEILRSWDGDYSNSDDDITLADWLDIATVGDTFTNEVEQLEITRTK